MIPSLNIPWILDRLRTLGDTSVIKGHLEPQDDRRTAGDDYRLPIDRLRSQLETIGFDLVDWRQEPRVGRGEARGTRPLSEVCALMLHQTAALVSLRQCLGIPAHCVVLEKAVVLLHPIRAYLYHGGAANANTIGIEIRCRACGIEGDLRTLWRSKRERNGYKDRSGRWRRPRSAEEVVQEATDLQLEAARFVCSYYIEETSRQDEHGEIDEVTFHRCSSSDRVSDPGSRIALEVGRMVARAYGLRYALTIWGDGKPCPTAWGGGLRVRYNWRVRGY